MNAGMKDMLNVMDKFLAMGLSLDDVIARSTWNPARQIKQDSLGHLSVGALADVAVADSGDDELYLRAVVAAVDGSRVIKMSATGPLADGEGLGHRLAALLFEEGAADLIGEHP
jgi:predicted amidohydrolase